MNHFKEYFNQQLNRPVIEWSNETIYNYTEKPIIEKPQQEEIDNIINNFKNNLVPGKNNIMTELLKKSGTEIRRKIKEMISII